MSGETSSMFVQFCFSFPSHSSFLADLTGLHRAEIVRNRDKLIWALIIIVLS